MTDLTMTTRDLRDLGQPHPTEHGLPASDTEDRIRRWGCRCRWWGAATLAADFAGSLAASTQADNAFWDDHASRTLVGITFILAGLVGSAVITAGLIERILRPMRTQIRRAMARADTNADIGAANRDAIDRNGRAVTEAVHTLVDIQKEMAAIRHELAGMQTKLASVPDYGQGLAQGARVAASVLGRETD